MPKNAVAQSLRRLCCTVLLLCPLTLAAVWGVRDTPAAAVPQGDHAVFLTFDDGPSANTEKVLDILRGERVSATFFVIGATTEHGMALYNRILEEGHSLGLHTYSHDVGRIYRSIGGFTDDFTKLEQWIHETTGASPKVCRMVGGSNSSYCSAVLREEILSYLIGRGYACYDWDVDSRDSSAWAVSSKQLAQNVIAAARRKPNQDLVILLHDDALRTTLPGALTEIISYFRQAGYRFEALREDTESVKRILPKAVTSN